MEQSIIALLVGIGFGYLFRNRKKSLKVFDGATMLFILILLFFMGVNLGKNQVVLQNITTAGLKALLISVGGIAGSICISLPVYRLFFKEYKDEK